MPVPFAIEQRLSRADLAAFRELMVNRYLTIEAAETWLGDHGYRISHGAVGNYLAHVRAESSFALPALAGIDSEARARQRITIWANQLCGDSLYRLALTAFYLLNNSGSAQRPRTGRSADRRQHRNSAAVRGVDRRQTDGQSNAVQDRFEDVN